MKANSTPAARGRMQGAPGISLVTAKAQPISALVGLPRRDVIVVERANQAPAEN